VTSNTQPHPRKGASNGKANRPGYPRKRKETQGERPVQTSDMRQQQLAAKRRRKTEALFFCTVPDCSADFTTKHRLESNSFFPDFNSVAIALSNTSPSSFNFAGHIKGYHLGIKDYVCGCCSYATAHPSDLVRHSKLKHA